MKKTSITTVAEYLESLPEDRRAAIQAVRKLINKHLPMGYRESFAWGMITWSVPLEVYPDTYNGQPLCYASLGNQKNHMALYLMSAYMASPQQKRLVAGFRAAGKKLDMGKACIRFKSLDDLPLDVIAEVAGAVPVKDFVAAAKQVRAGRK
jgi:uncharacterized protein YdhG (YjbR/CyaY superfamily)